MKTIIFLITILAMRQGLETKFIEKTEYFLKGCDSDLVQIQMERKQNECKDEDFR